MKLKLKLKTSYLLVEISQILEMFLERVDRLDDNLQIALNFDYQTIGSN